MRRESLPISQPCNADWERMDGDGAVRFCRRCEQQVHDLSAMSEAEARVFLAGGGQPCIRYTHDAGRIRFAERPGALPRLAAAAALALGSLASSACMGKRACPVPPDAAVAAPDAAAAEKPSEPAAVHPNGYSSL